MSEALTLSLTEFVQLMNKLDGIVASVERFNQRLTLLEERSIVPITAHTENIRLRDELEKYREAASDVSAALRSALVILASLNE